MAKLTAEQKANIINQYKSWDREWALQTAREIRDTQATPTQTPQTPVNPTSSYTEASEFGWLRDGGLRNTQKTTPSNVVETPTTETPTTQETPTKQEETAVSTVPEIKQQGELKPLSQEYYNQTSEEAQAKIINNLNWYKQTNPEYFSDYETFKKNFSYDARNEEQKQTLDTWYKWYTKWMELSWVPVQDLYTQWKDWSISDSDLQNLRISNPTKYAELQDTINKWNIIAAYDDDKWVDGTWLSLQDMAYEMAVQTFNKFMSGDSSSEASQYFRDYEAKMNDPEMLALSDQCTEVQEQMENIQSDLDAIKKSVEEEYAGTWATRSKINAIISDRSYELQLQLRTLNSEYNKYATQYNNRMQQYQNEFSMQLQEYQINQQARQQQMNELWFAMDLMNFETNEQKQQREWDYWVKQQEYQNGNINSKDYQTRYKAALSSVQNLLSQYEGIPMQRSAEQMAQDILKAIDNWSDLWAELTKINQRIQQKPEYKYLYNNTYRPASTWQNIQSYTIWDTEYVVYNGEMMTAADFNSKYGGKAAWSTWPAKAYNQIDNRAMNPNPMSIAWYDWPTLWAFLADAKNKKGNNGGWCGAFVNRYLKSIWVSEWYYDNDLSTKLNSVNTKIPTEWSIAVFDFGHITKETWENHGHVAIVTKVYDDGSFDVIESNFNSDKKVWIRQHIDPTSNSVKWFFDPSQPPAWSNATDISTSTLSNQDQQKASAMLKQIRSWAMTNSDMSSARDWLIENGYWTEFEEALDKGLKLSLSDAQIRVKNDANNTFKTNSIVKEFEESVNQIEQLQTALNDASWVWDMSAIFTFMKTLDPTSVVRESEFNSAAATAWVINPSAIWQSLERSVDWKFLTPKQREDFKKIAKEFIKTKAQNYNIKYNDLVKDYKNAGIDEQWLPTNMAEVVLKSINWWDANQSTYQSVNSSSFTPSWASKYTSQSSYSSNSYVNVEWADFPSTF